MTTFDGIVCFGGEDFWYHNRGHYDMQMMRELSRVVPVLYVNSIGMRTPRIGEGAMFLRRVTRKLKSLSRGLARVREDFWVLSPLVPPGSMRFGRRLLSAQVRRAARRAGIRRPLVWVACPPASDALRKIPASGLVYQRTDRYESYPGVDPDRIRGCHESLKERADLTLYCSRALFSEEAAACRSAAFIDHGVDYEHFARAGDEAADADPALRDVPRPRAGFVGGIDAHTFDPELFCEVARSLPDVHFVLVGASSLPEGWCTLPNVHALGQRPYEAVAGLMAACDVLIMPWNANEWIRACNPVKLKEYLAVGRPVVTTPFDELAHYAGLVRVAEGPERFAEAVRAALDEPHSAAPQRERVRLETWREKGRQALAELASRGLEPDERPAASAPQRVAISTLSKRRP